MDFLGQVVHLIVSSFLSLGLVNTVLIVGIVVGLFLLTRFVSAITTNEYVKANQTLLAMLGDTLFNAIMLVAWGKVDYSEFEEKALDYEREYGRYIDPRMWYVLERAEDWLEGYGFQVEFDELLAIAESVYRQADLDGKLPPRIPDDEDIPVAVV
jgi:hypothetical protein